MNSYDLAKTFIAERGYRILEDEADDGHIVFRFQMNTIHLYCNPDDDNFIMITLPNFTNVTDDNIAQVKEKCHEINKNARLVKLYVLNDIIMASVEVYYLAKEDFMFQMGNALKHLVAAKTMYKKMNE